MTFLIVALSLILITIIAIQIGKVSELAAKIRGEEEMQEATNRRQSAYMVIFMVVFLLGCIISGVFYKNYMLGFGPHESASAHGGTLDNLFKVTLFFTGIVFILTQVLLFYFAYKYRAKKGSKATYFAHDTRLELIWTIVPALVMTGLVVSGLDAWNTVMADLTDEEDYIEIEATGFQFGWNLRYPGPDGQLGEKNFRLISGSNPIGQNWQDLKNLDDFHPGEIVLPKGKKVRVRITAQDVLHNFYLPHFRVKMDAVPGMPTYFVFTPDKTTEEYRQLLRDYPEYNVPADPKDPESKLLWEVFDFELACAELCGRGHYSMRRVVRIVEPSEFEAWQKEQPSYYFANVRGKADDPWTDRVFDAEIGARKAEFTANLEKALTAATPEEKVLPLKYIMYETGSAKLASISRYELDNLVEAMKTQGSLQVEIGGHTDNTGDAASNLQLSQQRAQSVADYLTSKGIAASRLRTKGYGDTQPIDTNDTEDGKAKNRRTELRIIGQ